MRSWSTPVRFHFRGPIAKRSRTMDLDAYNRCVDDHSDGLFRFAARHLRDRDAAKDIVQDSFLRLWLKLEQVDGSRAKSYLFTIAHHLIVDSASKAKRRARYEPGHEDLLTTTQPRAGLQALIDKSLATLSPLQRTLVLLRDLEGFSYKEISDMTGLDVTKVKVYLFRARKALQAFIGDLDLVL